MNIQVNPEDAHKICQSLSGAPRAVFHAQDNKLWPTNPIGTFECCFQVTDCNELFIRAPCEVPAQRTPAQHSRGARCIVR
eukprot:4631248-Prymnesium_polylepis.2